MKTVIILGSVRTERQGHKAAYFIQKCLNDFGMETVLVDCKIYNLPMLDFMYKEMKDPEQKFKDLHDIFVSADGFILVTAEYNHGIPPALKNMLDHFQSEFFFKPAGIVSYSEGYFGGARAVEPLRSVSAELGMPAIPIAYHIPKIKTSFDDEGNPTDPAAPSRAERFIKEFDWYIRAMKAGREGGTPY